MIRRLVGGRPLPLIRPASKLPQKEQRGRKKELWGSIQSKRKVAGMRERDVVDRLRRLFLSEEEVEMKAERLDKDWKEWVGRRKMEEVDLFQRDIDV